jgi:hypothetical protein
MSWRATMWVQSLTGADGVNLGRKMVLFGLAKYADRDNGVAFPSIARLAEFACIDRRSVRRMLTELVQAGLVAAESVRNGGRKRTTPYRLLIPPGFGRNGSGGPPDSINEDSESAFSENEDSESAFCVEKEDSMSAFGERKEDSMSAFSAKEDSESVFMQAETAERRTHYGQKEDSESSQPVIEPKEVSKKGSESRGRAPARAHTRDVFLSRFSNENWEFTDERRAVAADLGLDPDPVFRVFSAWHRSRPGDAGLSADWDASWQLWCLREVGRNERRDQGPQPRARRETQAEALLRMADEIDAEAAAEAKRPKVLQ